MKAGLDSNDLKFYIGKRLFRRAFRRHGKPRLSGTVLDVGSGTAPYGSELNGCRLVTVERELRFRPAVVGSAALLPFAARTFDGAICTEVLEHLPEPEACLAEIRRVLKPGGRVYVTTPMTWYLHYEPHDYFRFTPHGLKYLLEKHGFGVLVSEPIGGLAAVIVMVAFEKFYNMLFKLVFFVPKAARPGVIAPIIIPIAWVLAQVTAMLDLFGKRWIFSVCLVAQKGAEG